MTITIIGLGPGDPELLTRRAWRLLEEAAEVYLRTARHPGVPALPNAASYHSFDAWYDRAQDFETLYREIAAEVVRLGDRPGGVVYAVPGHPLMGETSVTHILALAEGRALPVMIVDGLSFIEPTLSALRMDGMRGLQNFRMPSMWLRCTIRRSTRMFRRSWPSCTAPPSPVT